MTRRPLPRGAAAAAAVVALAVGLPACTAAETAMPRCRPDQRLAIVAQSRPGAAYVPCIEALPPGWTLWSFTVSDRGTRFELRSDRSEEPVTVELVEECEVSGATPVAPRDEGVRTYRRVDSISPRYTGRLSDVFPGGCVTYDYDFARGPHIALTDELERAVALYPRRQLRQELEEHGIELD